MFDDDINEPMRMPSEGTTMTIKGVTFEVKKSKIGKLKLQGKQNGKGFVFFDIGQKFTYKDNKYVIRRFGHRSKNSYLNVEVE